MSTSLPASAFPVGFSSGKGATFTVAILIGLAMYLHARRQTETRSAPR